MVSCLCIYPNLSPQTPSQSNNNMELEGNHTFQYPSINNTNMTIM